MSDLTLNRYIGSGTTAERTAFVPDPPTTASGPTGFCYLWHDTDDDLLYMYEFVGPSWIAIGPSAGVAVPVSIVFTVDGGGSDIVAGVINKFRYIRQALTLIGWSLQADQPGDVEIDVFVDDPDSIYPPTTSIVGTTAPELSTADFAKSSSLAGWTTAIPADTCIGIQVISPADITELVVQLDFTLT